VVAGWDSIVRDHGGLVFTTAKRILGQAADAEDVAQEVFLEALRLGQSKAVRSWSGLLRRLTICRALDRLRQRKPAQPLQGAALRDYSPGPEQAAMARELVERLRLALTQLPPREAEVFCLRYFDDLSYQQIAESLEMQSNAVAQALHKARTRLEALLGDLKEASHAR
jgi:RNA polymerase sigma-70 factor (ECF subfamily)